MFKNLLVYRMAAGWTMAIDRLDELLAQDAFTECGASQEKSVGWIPPRGKAHGAFVEVVDGQWLLKLMIETKAVPASVIKRKVDEQCAQIEASTGRKPGKKESRDIKDDAKLALLPMAFSKQGTVQVWIDPKAGLLLTDAGSSAKADEVMTWLIKAVDGLAVTLINTQTSPAAAMATWLSTKESPPDFTVDRECELKAPDESKSVVRYTRHALDTDEVTQHIAMGKMPTRLAMTWNDRVSFVLTEALQIKKIAFLEGVFEGNTASPGDGKDDNFDTDTAIATGELQGLIPDLIEALGGEMPTA